MQSILRRLPAQFRVTHAPISADALPATAQPVTTLDTQPRLPIRFHLGLVVFYLLVGFLVMNVLIFNIGTQVPSGPLNDYDQFTWNNWWIGYSINTLHTDPYYTNYILYPFQHNLSMHALTPILYPPYALLHPLFGDPATMNVLLWLSFALDGYIAFLFLRRWTRSNTFALLGGLLFAFSPGMMDHAINYHANMWLMFWFPAMLLLWERVATAQRHAGLWKALLWAAVFGVALWGLWMTDLELMIWMPCLLLPFGLLTLVQARGQRVRLALLGVMAIVIMLVLCFAIAPFPALLHGDPVGTTSPSTYDTTRSYSLPLSAFFLIPGSADRGIGRVLVVLVVLALFMRPNRPIRWFWFGTAWIALILSLGSDVQIAGVLIPLPYRIVHAVFHGLYRWPSRFAPMGILALLVFVGLSFKVSKPRPRALIAVIGTLAILVDFNLLTPFPTQTPVKDSLIYQQIGQDTDDYAVLFIPVTAHSGWAQVGGDLGQRAQYLQIYTHKRQINGGFSRIPDIEHVYWEQPPLMSFLSGSNYFVAPTPFNKATASAEFSRLIHDWPIGYVTVHLDWLDPARIPPIMDFLNSQPDLCFVTQEENVIAYRARVRGCPLAPTAAQPITITFGQRGDEPYLMGSWYPRESIGGADARWSHDSAAVKVKLTPGHDYVMKFKALGYGAQRQVTIDANGSQLASINLLEDWTQQSVKIPASAISAGSGAGSGDVIVTLTANGALSPAVRSSSADQRALSAAYQWIEFDPVD